VTAGGDEPGRDPTGAREALDGPGVHGHVDGEAEPPQQHRGAAEPGGPFVEVLHRDRGARRGRRVRVRGGAVLHLLPLVEPAGGVDVAQRHEHRVGEVGPAEQGVEVLGELGVAHRVPQQQFDRRRPGQRLVGVSLPAGALAQAGGGLLELPCQDGGIPFPALAGHAPQVAQAGVDLHEGVQHRICHGVAVHGGRGERGDERGGQVQVEGVPVHRVGGVGAPRLCRDVGGGEPVHGRGAGEDRLPGGFVRSGDEVDGHAGEHVVGDEQQPSRQQGLHPVRRRGEVGERGARGVRGEAVREEHREVERGVGLEGVRQRGGEHAGGGHVRLPGRRPRSTWTRRRCGRRSPAA